MTPTPTPMFGISDSTYKTMGEEEGVRQLVDCFYNIMDCTKAYQSLFNLHTRDIVMTKDKLSRFLMAWMGGERTYQSTYGTLNIPAAHAHLNVTQALVDNWLNCMAEALVQLGHDAKFSEYLINQLAIPAQRILMVSNLHHKK